MMLKTARRYATALFIMVNPNFGFNGVTRTCTFPRRSLLSRNTPKIGATRVQDLNNLQGSARHLSMSASEPENEGEESIRRRSVPEHIIAETDIFCNRELKMESLKAIGFDMDYTLAQYYQEFDLLAYEGAKEKLVHMLKYPNEILDYIYDTEFFVRGLVIDKEQGNILKVDRHKYCRVAYHGFSPLTPAERKDLYISPPNKLPSYTGDRFVNVDTLFTLVDAVLFSQLIELKDSEPGLIEQSYAQIYTDVRKCVDQCHRDGVIKKKVAEDPSKYIIPDPGMIGMLKHLREEGFKIFLVTNSEWEYTNVVMNYLCGNVEVDSRNTDWVDLFDVSFCLSCKPAFLVDPRRPLFRIDTENGLLQNCDGVDNDVDEFLKEGKVFQMGSWHHLQKMLNVTKGDEILYVGDHMYSDVLRTKRTLGWRTCLVVPELENEIHAHRSAAMLGRDVRDLRNLQYDLEEYVDDVMFDIRKENNPEILEGLEQKLNDLENQKMVVKKVLREKANLFHYQFHPVWGQIFKAGYQDSRFANQIAEYSCLYTSKASNLGSTTKRRSFRTSSDVLPHDHLMKQTEIGGQTRIQETRDRIRYLASKFQEDEGEK